MVREINLGIIGIQGAVSEHQNILKKIFKEKNIKGTIVVVKKKNDLGQIDGLIIPGGESTTISHFLKKTGLKDVIKEKIKQKSLAVMGTCAGCVILSSRLTKNKDGKDVEILEAMDIEVERNAFGRQKKSFEKKIQIKGFEKPFNAVFIRAPVIQNSWGKTEILAKTEDKIVMVKQENMLALSFHPELTDDTSIHEYFLKMIT